MIYRMQRHEVSPDWILTPTPDDPLYLANFEVAGFVLGFSDHCPSWIGDRVFHPVGISSAAPLFRFCLFRHKQLPGGVEADIMIAPFRRGYTKQFHVLDHIPEALKTCGKQRVRIKGKIFCEQINGERVGFSKTDCDGFTRNSSCPWVEIESVEVLG